MKKRVIYFLLTLVLIFSAICTPFVASADDTTDYLVEEMKTNMPEFDPSKYTANSNGSPMIIGSTVHYSGSGSDSTFSLYIFNPRQLDITGALINFYLSYWNDSLSVDLSFVHENGFRFYLDDRSIDKLYYKLSFKLGLDAELTSLIFNDCLSYFSVVSTQLLYKEGSTEKKWSISETFTSTFERTEDGNYNVAYEAKDLAQLDVRHTSYKIGNVGTDLNTKYEIFTAYFSIPEEYIEYYESFYSATSTYTKKHTTPILWGNNPNSSMLHDLYRTDDFYFASSDRDYYYTEYNENFYAHTVLDNDFECIDTVSKKCYADYIYRDRLAWWFYDDAGADAVISSIYLEEYIEHNQFRKLFDSVEYLTTTRTVEENFDAPNYFQKADWQDYWKDFGWKYGILAWFKKDSPDVIQELIGDNLIDVNYKDYLEDAPHLFIFDEDEVKRALDMTDEEISETYLVDVSDVSEFREYIKVNPYTVLYRFEVTDYFSDELIGFKETDIDYVYPNVSDGYSYGVSVQYMFFDFEVIDITFKLEDQYLSVCTKSEKRNISGNSTVIDPDPGFALNPDAGTDIWNDTRDKFKDVVTDTSTAVGGFFGRFFNLILPGLFSGVGAFFKGLFGNAWKWVAPVAIGAGIILLILLLLWIFRSGKNSNFFDLTFRGISAGQKKRELALRGDDITFRKEELAHRRAESSRNADLKAEEIASRERSSLRDAELRGREIDQKERSSARDAESKEKELKQRERESKRSAKTRKTEFESRKDSLKGSVKTASVKIKGDIGSKDVKIKYMSKDADADKIMEEALNRTYSKDIDDEADPNDDKK